MKALKEADKNGTVVAADTKSDEKVTELMANSTTIQGYRVNTGKPDRLIA